MTYDFLLVQTYDFLLPHSPKGNTSLNLYLTGKFKVIRFYKSKILLRLLRIKLMKLY